MNCPDRDCHAPYIPGGRYHRHVYHSLAGFTIGDPVTAVHSGQPVGTVSRLEKVGSRVAVMTRLPGQITASRWMEQQLRGTT